MLKKEKSLNFIRVAKFLSIIALLLIISAIAIIANTPAASDYEISIYDVFPIHFWFLIISSVAIGQIIIVLDIYSNDKDNKIWLMGLAVILIAIIIMSSMPYVRGYATHGIGDHLEHIGESKDIIYTGTIKPYDFYPSIRMLAANIGLVGNINIMDVSSFLPNVFRFLFIIGFIIFSMIFLERHDRFLFSVLLSSSLLFFASSGTYLVQYQQSFLLLPIILFLYFKRSEVENSISFNMTFIIFSIGLIFYHPLTFLLIILIFSVSAISTFISKKKLDKIEVENKKEPLKTKVIMPVVLLSIIFVAWYFSFSTIINNFVKVFSSIFYGTGESFLSAQLSRATEYNVLISDMIRIGFFTYGIHITIGVLSLISIFYIYHRIFWKKDKQISNYKFLFLLLCIFTFGGLAALSFLFDFIVGWGRFYMYLTFFSLLLMPIALAYPKKKKKTLLKKTSKYVKIPIVLIIIFIISITSVFIFYRSPLRDEPSQAVTSEECIGFTWLIKERNTEYYIDQILFSQYRFYNALHQKNSSSKNIKYLDTSVRDHFGYNDSVHLGKQYGKNNYLLLTTLDHIVYPSLYKNYEEYWHFTEEEFNMLNTDLTVYSIYSNSGFDVFLINPN